MIRVAFRHLRNTDNIGDRWCSPYDHFDWASHSNCQAEVGDLRETTDDYDIGIFGGGKVLRELAKSPSIRLGGGRVNIGWGLSTVQRNPFSFAYFRAKRQLHLVGSRDWDGTGGAGGYDWVPCASSAHDFFDAVPAATSSVVFYGHNSKTAKMGIGVPESIPSRTNHGGTLEDALKFIASGETVVSNSYHGVFWALLMGRRVLCLPFSNKFSRYRLPPGYSTAASWQSDVQKARAQPELLSLCRAASQRFRDKVAELIDAAARAQSRGLGR